MRINFVISKNQMSSKIVKCPKCNGKGYHTNYFAAVITLGLGYLYPNDNMYHEKCYHCKGKGYIKINL